MALLIIFFFVISRIILFIVFKFFSFVISIAILASYAKELEQKESALKDSIILKLSTLSNKAANSDKVSAVGKNFKLSYNIQKKTSVDSDALKKSGLFDMYKKESVFRVLRIYENK